MKSRYKAEAQSLCDAGLASYLRTKHQSRVSKGILTGVSAGTVLSTLLFGYSRYTGTHLSSFYHVLPFFVSVITGTGYGLVTSDVDDALHTEDFNEVCDALEAEAEAEADGDDLDAE